MTTIKQSVNPVQVGDEIVKKTGEKIMVTDANKDDVVSKLDDGDILMTESGAHKGSVAKIKSGGDEEVLLDCSDIGGGTPLTADTSDDASTKTMSESDYRGFWSKLFGGMTQQQKDTLTPQVDTETKAAYAAKAGAAPTEIVNAKDAARAIATDGGFWSSSKQFFTRDDFKQKLSDPNLDPTTRKAIEFLLKPENSSVFDAIDTFCTGGQSDGIISRRDLGRFSEIFDTNDQFKDKSTERKTSTSCRRNFIERCEPVAKQNLSRD